MENWPSYLGNGERYGQGYYTNRKWHTPCQMR